MGGKLQNRLAEAVAPALPSVPDLMERLRRCRANLLTACVDDPTAADRAERRMGRIIRWAKQRDKDELAEHYAWLLVLALEERRTRLLLKNFGAYTEGTTQFLLHRLDETKMARLRGAKAKLARDPKQAAKAQALKLWQDWKAGRTRYKSGAAFARFVTETLSAIESEKTVERWVTAWRKEALLKARGG